MLNEYGDDSVAQLGGAHLACEGVSNVLTKVLEWGRLMAYLEQSTRYVPYTDRPNGRWKYHVPAELDGSPLRDDVRPARSIARSTPTRAGFRRSKAHFRAKYPKAPDDSDGVYRSVIRAKALDTLRGLLPAATHVQRRPVRHRPGVTKRCCCACSRIRSRRSATHARLMLAELRQVIPAFLARVDQPDRGGRWIEYFAETRRDFETAAAAVRSTDVADEPRGEVTLTDFDPDGEIESRRRGAVRAVGAAGRSAAGDRAAAVARRRAALLRAYVGERANRRHKPGRAFERTQLPLRRARPTTARSAICSATGC